MNDLPPLPAVHAMAHGLRGGEQIPLSEVSEMMETVTSAMHDCHHELRITPSRVFANIHVKDDKVE